MNQPHVVFSNCKRYRYQLWYPTGIKNEKCAVGIFANPSTATDLKPDPTMTRWRNYCKLWNYGWAGVVNVRAWRETDPKKLPPDPQGFGPDNDKHILEACAKAEIVVCGWGHLGGTAGNYVLDLLARNGIIPHALKLTKSGAPCHPLYLKSNLVPVPIARLREASESAYTT